MGENTKIEWADHTFNPWVGCTKVSPACTNCYAEGWAKRTGQPELWRGDRRRTSAANWRKPIQWNRETPGARVFCSSLADVFEAHDALDPIRADLWRVIESTPNLTWLLLTKRPENIRRMVPPSWLEDWPSHVWTGATVEDQKHADERVPHLLRAPGLHFLSCEPLLRPVTLDSVWMETGMALYSKRRARETNGWSDSGISWVIAGGESGPKARPSHPDWFRSLRDRCAAGGQAFFFKQWGAWIPRSHTTRRHPWHEGVVPDGDPCWRVDVPASAAWGTLDTTGTLWPTTTPWNGHDDDGTTGEALVFRSTAGMTGRLLDGRTHDEVPR